MVAFVKNGNHITAAANQEKSSPRYYRNYQSPTANVSYVGHAEMILCDKVSNIQRKTVYVTRFLSDGTATMARPCRFCQRHLYFQGVRNVRYTDWDGNWQKMRILENPY